MPQTTPVLEIGIEEGAVPTFYSDSAHRQNLIQGNWQTGVIEADVEKQSIASFCLEGLRGLGTVRCTYIGDIHPEILVDGEQRAKLKAAETFQ